MSTQQPDQYVRQLQAIAAVVFAERSVATPNDLLQFYCVSALLGVGLVLALVTLGVRQYRGLDRWVFRLSSGYILPNSTVLWLGLDSVYLVAVQFFIWYPDHKIAFTSLVYLALHLAAYSVSWGYAIAALTYSNSTSGVRKSPPFILSPLVVNTVCCVAPTVIVFGITPLTLIANHAYNVGLDTLKEVAAVLTRASVNSAAGRPVDVSTLPALQASLGASLSKSVRYVKITYICWSTATALLEIFFITSAIVYFRLLRTSMNAVGESLSRQAQAVRVTYRNLMLITIVMIVLGGSYLVIDVLIASGTQNIAVALYVLWSFSIFGALINVAIFMRSLSQVSPSQTQATTLGRGTTHTRLAHLETTISQKDSTTVTKNIYDIELGSTKYPPPGVKVSQYD